MTWLLAITTMSAFAQQATVTGPDSFLKVNVSVKQGIPVYSVTYKDRDHPGRFTFRFHCQCGGLQPGYDFHRTKRE